MDLMSMLLNAGGGSALQQLSKNFGLSEDQTKSAVSVLLPALGSGLARNAAQPSGLEALLGALTSGNHEQYLDRPDILNSGDAVDDGNGILGHVFGSKDVSRGVARNAAQKTGISEDILKKMLPSLAGLAMGMLSKQNRGAGMQMPGAGSSSSGVMDVLSQFLDSNQNGSVLDEVVGMASKFFRK